MRQTSPRWRLGSGGGRIRVHPAHHQRLLLANLFVVGFESTALGGGLTFVESRTVDEVLRSFNRRVQLVIFSEHRNQIVSVITRELERMATYAYARPHGTRERG